MSTTNNALIAAIFLLVLGPMAAQATLVTGYFEGSVTYADFGYPVGTPARMDFSYDTGAAPVPVCGIEPGKFEFCEYSGMDWLTIELTLGPDSFALGPADYSSSIYVQNALAPGYDDEFQIWSEHYLFETVENLEIQEFSLISNFIQSSLGDLIDGTALPTDLDYLPELAGGQFERWDFVYDNNTQEYLESDYVYATFQWDRIFLSSDIPEPTSLALLGLGLVGMGMRRRMRP